MQNALPKLTLNFVCMYVLYFVVAVLMRYRVDYGSAVQGFKVDFRSWEFMGCVTFVVITIPVVRLPIWNANE